MFDGFAGSGTTVIACEIRGRSARVMELDEHFADVIICRWQEFTGLEATLVSGESYEVVKKMRLESCKNA